MARKSSQTVVLERVNEVLDLKLAGASISDIRRYASENGWKLGQRQLERYMAQADADLAASLQRDRDKSIDFHLAARRYLYARAVQLADLATASRILKDQAELEGLYPAKQLEHAGKGGGPIKIRTVRDMTDAELLAIAAGDPEAR